MKDIELTNDQKRLLEKHPGILAGTDQLGYYVFVRGKSKDELVENIHKTLKLI